MSPLRRKVAASLGALVGIPLLGLLFSFHTGFSTWPWQKPHPYRDGELGLHIGAKKAEVWERILALQREGLLVPGAGQNNDSRASTTELSQVQSLDLWSFPMPPCCRCTLELTFESSKLTRFKKHCNYAPEGP